MHISLKLFGPRISGLKPAFKQSRPVHRISPQIGNLAMQDMAQRNQRPGFRISHPTDSHEQEAGRIADRALGTRDLDLRSANTANAHRKTTDATGSSLFSCKGQPLPEPGKSYFESMFGRDLGHVRIHNDTDTHRVASELNARAFAHNNHIGFSEDQYRPDTNDGKHLLAHELAHVTQMHPGSHADSGTVYRETWNIDDSTRTVERGILVQLIFENTWTDWWNDTGWTSARKNTFRSNFESSIENTFNSSTIVLNPPASAADVLPPAVMTNGYKPRVDIQLVPDGEFSTAEDWEVDVASNAAGVRDPRAGYMQSSSNRSYGTLNEATNLPVEKRSSGPGVTQIPTVHEFGHFIGLDHPGHGLSESERSPGASEYGHSGTDTEGRAVHGPTDLMGGGMGLRPFYFGEWAEAVDDHIAALRRQRTLEELQRALDEFFSGRSDMGDFPVAEGPTRFG